MPQQLLLAALEQAERSEPVVRAAALLHIARVLDAFDHAEAQRLLERGIALAEGLSEPEREVILGQAVSLAATVSPDLAIRLATAVQHDMPAQLMTKALSDMIGHGHLAEAVQYLSDTASVEDYPFDAARQAIDRAKDEATRLRVFRGAIGAMRRQMASGRPAGLFQGPARFSRLFTRWWRLLPVDEATEVVRDLVRQILAEPDGPIRASHNDVRFSSTREHHLFQILGPLRRLDPELADSLIREHAQLAFAAARYPDGHESIEAAALERATREPWRAPVEPPDYISVGRRLIPMAEALETDFRDAFELALRFYATESDPGHPNDAPQECWPSAQEFRNILYKAGQHEGRAAVRHLERIPHPALRLFALIELAAALAGLPQIGGMSISPGPHGFRQSMAMRGRDRDSGAPPTPPFAAIPPGGTARKPNLPPSYDARIAPTRRTRAEGPSGGSGPDYWVIEGAPLRPVLSTLYDMPETRIDLAPSLDTGRYDLVLVLPRHEHQETMTRLMREGIEKQFHVTRELRPMEVDVLTAPNGIKAHEAQESDSLFASGSIGFVERARDGQPQVPEGLVLASIMDLQMVRSEKPSSPEDAMHEMRYHLRRAVCGSRMGDVGINSIGDVLTMEQLCRLLESGLDRPIIDETQLSGTYAVNVHSDAVDTREFIRVLCDRLGLVVTPARREVSMLVVRPVRARGIDSPAEP
jgi:uncharacterized protein (TIGR03435 family)